MPATVEDAGRRFRVLLFHCQYRFAGGEETVVETEAALLAKHGNIVERQTWLNQEIAFETFGDRARAAVNCVWNKAAEREVGAAIERFGPDVLHVHNTFPGASPSVIAAAASRRIPVVVTVHNYRLACLNALLYRDGKYCERCVGGSPFPGIYHGCYRGSVTASAVAAAMLAVHRIRGTWHREVAAFLAVSLHVGDVLRRTGIPADRIEVRRHTLLDDPRVGEHGGNFALVAGRLSPEKGIAGAVEAWIQANVPFDLAVAGDGPERDRIESMARRHPRVRVLGAIPREELISMMREARLLLLPSRSLESATPPLVAVEAMATGLPILASGEGYLGAWIRGKRVGWTANPGDLEDWVARIRESMQDGPGRVERGAAARLEYERSHTPEACLDRLEATYRRVCDGRAALNRVAS